MKLLRVHIISAETCGGLLDGLDLEFRSPFDNFYESEPFEPLCFIGPNGAGKSQLLQIIAEVFQSVFHGCVKQEEREDSNPALQFELEYIIFLKDENNPTRVRVSRKSFGRRNPSLKIEKQNDDNWEDIDPTSSEARPLLPHKVIGYTSGSNETLSIPFLISRRGYAGDVAQSAITQEDQNIPDTRLMLIDYGTHLEVLVANLLLGERSQRKDLLDSANLRDLNSFRCIIQLAHNAAPNNPMKGKNRKRSKEVLLTPELELYLDRLKRCSTCYSYEEKTRTYIFDYLVSEQTRDAFRYFWKSSFHLYSSFHKFSMLNDLVLPRTVRELFQKNKSRNFASRPPEPLDEDKVFRFERVRFLSQNNDKEVDYVSLSDGEHQLSQILSTFCMLSSPNILFLLDEPESHFNPLWRVKFISTVLDLHTKNGNRRKKDSDRKKNSKSIVQECLITTHSPFVPSDMYKEQVFIFSKNEEGRIEVENPDMETRGATFDSIIERCFEVRPPFSQLARDEISHLMRSKDIEEIRDGIQRLGNSVEKAFLADRLRELTRNDDRNQI